MLIKLIDVIAGVAGWWLLFAAGWRVGLGGVVVGRVGWDCDAYRE